ncbi:HP1 family phage holin [Enterobacter hormaechei]|uniref:HP1 family phage holin n=1 Tax=Enterobacter hormaechei TaxID=158836 RepID=UPI003F431087
MNKLWAWLKNGGRKTRMILIGGLVAFTAYIHFSADRVRERLAILWGTFTATAGALSLGDVAIIVGILCTIGSLLINWYYKARDDKRKEAIFRKGRIIDE